MFCTKCGGKLADDSKFCIHCGARVASVGQAAGPGYQQMKPVSFVPALCAQCGATVQVDPGQDAAICTYCKTPFIVAKAINNYNIQTGQGVGINNADRVTIVTDRPVSIEGNRTKDGREALKAFKKAYKEYEAATKKRLIPQTVRVGFGRTRPGTADDIDEGKLYEAMSRFLYDYDYPRDENSLLEFYIYAKTLSEDDYYEVHEEDYYLQEAWDNLADRLHEILEILYPKSETVQAVGNETIVNKVVQEVKPGKSNKEKKSDAADTAAVVAAGIAGVTAVKGMIEIVKDVVESQL